MYPQPPAHELSTASSHTLEQVAQVLNVSLSTVQRRIRRGLIRAVKIGARVRIPKEEVNRLLAEGVA